MPEPSFLGDGDDPRRSDTKWLRWTKILGHYQNMPGALPENNPRRSDGIWVVKQKVLCAIDGVSYAQMASLAGSAGSGCAIHQQNAGIQVGELGAGSDGSAAYVGQISYDPGANITVCKITATLSAVGTISGQTWRMEIWTLSGNDLDTLVQASTGVTGNNGWSETEVDFTFAGAALSSGTGYAVVLTRGAADASNYVQFHYTADGALSGASTLWSTAGTFTTSIGNDMRMTIYTG